MTKVIHQSQRKLWSAHFIRLESSTIGKLIHKFASRRIYPKVSISAFSKSPKNGTGCLKN